MSKIHLRMATGQSGLSALSLMRLSDNEQIRNFKREIRCLMTF
ncbi:hypothetical protein BSU04_28035 [Caballeronia sordidicola]|uniref:Uncharacterized protein n=1 Tax=Caballeronia sordidicola TaxID=196367 RepID=A0A226WWX3_CABSO|nr:hypothetical protein BSU04_28035 [Caballeronia sordidicola]